MPIENIRIGASVCTSKKEYYDNPEKWESIAEERLITEISFLLQKEKSEKIVTDNMIERRIDLCVTTPEVFWKIVREEAEKIAMRFMTK